MKEIAFGGLWYWLLIIAAACYLIGSFNFAVLISKLKKNDIRHVGSGNPGTMNMTRTYGLKIGAINFFLDVAKGGLPAVICWAVFRGYVFAGCDVLISDFIRYFCGLFVILGHVFPVFMKFKGGKGIASTMGLFLFALPCDTWWFVFIAAGIYCVTLGFIALTEWGSMGSLLGVSGLTVFQAVIFIIRYQAEILNVYVIVLMMTLLAINIITWARHGANIVRLLAGEEHHTAVVKRKKKV